NQGAEVGGSNCQNHAGGHKSKGISYEGYSPPCSSTCYSCGQLFDLLANANVRRARARAGPKEKRSRRRAEDCAGHWEQRVCGKSATESCQRRTRYCRYATPTRV